MTGWQEFRDDAPELAAVVRRCFAERRHAVMATLRSDGSPRLSGTEVRFDDDHGPAVGMPADAVRARDLARDPRVALHGPTVDPPEDDPASWLGDAKLAGWALPLPEAPAPGAVGFGLDLREVVWTGIAASGDELVVRSWHPGRGLVERRRR